MDGNVILPVGYSGFLNTDPNQACSLHYISDSVLLLLLAVNGATD